MRVGWTNDPDNLNPFIGAETSSFEIWMLNYDFLVGYGLDLQPKPALATSWETSGDGKVWTFHLREGVNWQDGEPFTADDVAFTYNYIIENEMGAFSSLTTGIDKVVAIDDHHGRDPLQPAQGQHPAYLDPDPARAHLEQGQAGGCRQRLRQQAADHRHRPVPGGRDEEGRLHEDGRQPHLLGREADRG